MQISGSIKLWRMIFQRATWMGCSHIYWISPSYAVLWQGSNYVCMYLPFFISHSVGMHQREARSLQGFLARATRLRATAPGSPFYALLMHTMTVSENAVEFDGNTQAKFELSTTLTLLEQSSPFIDKAQQLLTSSLQLTYPYLRLLPEAFKTISRWFKDGVKVWGRLSAGNHYLRFFFREERLFAELDESAPKDMFKDPHQVHALESDFVLLPQFANREFRLYGADLLMLRTWMREVQLQHVLLIPFTQFTIMEAHGEGILAKTHTAHENRDK